MTWLQGWLAAAHPFPLAAVLVLTALIGLAAAEGRPDGPRLTLVLLAMLLSQLAIGWSNDYLDREADERQQPWKPIPSGRLDARLLPPAIGLALVGSLAAGVALGLLPLLLLIAGTACGLAYNVGLKDSRWSALPFILALGVLAPFVWTALDVYHGEFLLLYAIGTPLALAAHVANALPDIEGDRAAGRGGLAVALGRGRALALLAGCLLAPLVVLAATFPAIEYETRVPGTESYVLVWAVMAYVVLCLAVAALPRLASGREADVWRFRLVAIAGVLLAAGWLVSV